MTRRRRVVVAVAAAMVLLAISALWFGNTESLEFPFQEASGFEDLETGEQIPVIPGKLRADYLAMMNAHLAALERSFTDHRIDYRLLDTSKPLDRALFEYLLSRERMSKTR